MSDVQANYDAMHVAADAGDADRAKELGDAVISDAEATTEQKAYANWRVGDTLARASRNDEAKPYLQRAAALGDASLQERSYQLLSDLAQFDAAEDGDSFATTPVRRIAAAQEALERSDPDGARQLATEVFEDDQAETVQKVMAALIAAEASFSLGQDDFAELYANWAVQNGDAENKAAARALLKRWKGYETADTAMDDGVTESEQRQVLDAAARARNNQDWSTAQRLLEELNAKDADKLSESEYGEMAYGIGEAAFHQADYHLARAWFALVPASHSASDMAQDYVTRIDEFLKQGDVP